MTHSERPTGTNRLPVYNGRPVRQCGDLLNLTSMWHATGRLPGQHPNNWLALPETQRFIQHLRTTPLEERPVVLADLSRLAAIRHIDPDLLFATTRGGKCKLWAHWQIALAYAQYLDPGFHAWCNDVVRDSFEHASASGPASAEPALPSVADAFAHVHERLDVLDRHAVDVLFLLTAVQELILGKRRPFSGSSQIVMRQAIALPPFEGRCPCCRTARILRPDGRPTVDAQFDHFFHPALNRPEHGWLICGQCHSDLSRGGYLTRSGKLAAFRFFRAAVLAFKQAQYRTTHDLF